jgi:hypothetical protein
MGDVAQASACFVCKLKILSSNPRPTKKEKKILGKIKGSLY